MSTDDATAVPIVLVHGWGGSFATTWEQSGFTELLADAGREVIGIDLLGHGSAPKPHQPEAYADLTERIVAELPAGPVDAVGFSLGALTLLRTALDDAGRFRRLVLAGIGRNVFERDEEAARRIVAAIEHDDDHDDDHDEHDDHDDDHDDDHSDDHSDNRARLFAQYAHQPGNDPVALAAIMKWSAAPLAPADLAGLDVPTLVVVGDQDFVLPADGLVDALPNARLTLLRRTDHFATPESFDFIDATLDFLDAIPA